MGGTLANPMQHCTVEIGKWLYWGRRDYRGGCTILPFNMEPSRWGLNWEDPVFQYDHSGLTLTENLLTLTSVCLLLKLCLVSTIIVTLYFLLILSLSTPAAHLSSPFLLQMECTDGALLPSLRLFPAELVPYGVFGYFNT